MLKHGKSTVLITLGILILSGLLALAYKEAHLLHRDPKVLMDRFYLLKQSHPDEAQNALKILLRQEVNYLPALHELSQIYLNEHHNTEALPLLVHLHELEPDNKQNTLALARLYYYKSDWDKAKVLLSQMEPTPHLMSETQSLVQQMNSSIPPYKEQALVIYLNPTKELPLLNQILLARFYQQQKNQPQQAEQLLALLDLISVDNPNIPMERGYLALQKKEDASALAYFLRAYNSEPSASTALQIAYLYVNQKQTKTAAAYFLAAMTSTEEHIKKTAAKGYQSVTQSTQLIIAKSNNASKESLLLDEFYHLKKHNKKAAWTLIQQIIHRYPNNLLALKEGGFLAIDEHHRADAIVYFNKAYNLSYKPDLAMQLAYLYDEPDSGSEQLTDKYLAYHYFNLATKSTDKSLELRAQNALTNLAGLQTKAFPSPFFSEIFFDPLSQSRFGLTIRPFIGRLGIEQNNRFQTKTYLVLRQTQDNKSFNFGELPQIYEDNVRITGLGAQISPFPSIPIVSFIEAGRAYDLVYRNRDRWRNDVRAGLMYYNEFGALPAYFERLQLNMKYYSTLYGDATYFSRYKNNIIATIKTHQGIRIAQYKSSMLNLYLSGRVIEDTRREFFNNIAEIGPGIGFTPSNRYRVELRYEHINGMYLPAGRTINPYGKYYINDIVQLFLYVKL